MRTRRSNKPSRQKPWRRLGVERLEQRQLLAISAVGLYSPTLTFCLRSANTSGPADITPWAYGGGTPTALAGDWNNDDLDTIGIYHPSSRLLQLSNTVGNTIGSIEFTFNQNGADSTWVPIAGDWNGDGTDTIGLYNPSNSNFYLRNSNTTGSADIQLGFGWVPTPPDPSLIPIAGDWDGNGTDTIGLYDPATSYFYLRDSNTTGTADHTLGFGTPPSSWKPVAGDWDGNGTFGVGL
jgi:hypothetical protein